MFFDQSALAVLKHYGVEADRGLSSREAEKRLVSHGRNILKEKKKKNLFEMFLDQLNEPMIYILLFAAAVSMFLGEYSDSLIILIVIVANAIIGVIQQNKAEKALDALKKLSAPKALVRRDGKVFEVNSADLVPGDIVIIEAGRFIPADLRLVETVNLKIEESALTGESEPVEKDSGFVADKDIPIGDRINMAYMSTYATYGRGVGVVAATGMDTEIGRIAKLLEDVEEEDTPLQKRLAELGKTLGIMAIVICSVIFATGLIYGRRPTDMLLTSIALAVAAIPEGLPAVVTIVLALGVQRMIKSNAIVRRLPAVETLGSVNIVCSDKTGTLTQNKMTVTKVYVDGELLDAKDLSKDRHSMFIDGFLLCNDASIDGEKAVGDPTEIALVQMAANAGLQKRQRESECARIDEMPFDSSRKMMTTVHKYHGRIISFTKGALDHILKVTDKVNIKGQVTPLSHQMKNDLLKAAEQMGGDALRVLALAYKEVTDLGGGELEDSLVFLGLAGMIDPPRREVKDSIIECTKAGITTVMITGDHKNTAFAIAKELGIAQDKSQVISGEELDIISQEQLNKIIGDFRVFARVSPEHKVMIVKAFKAGGNIVSMTGDGVNDAPSLRNADIGVAMGITGTDVAKGAADMVLTDDNFSTIVKAIREGRNIYANIKKTVLFLLSCNLGEVFAVFAATLINVGRPPLEAIHILWVNLVTDSLPALALGVDPGDPGVMNEKPRSPRESLFAHGGWLIIILNGIFIGSLTLFAYKYGAAKGVHHAQTMAFMVLSFSQLVHALNMRNLKKSVFKIGVFSNIYLIWAILFGALLQFMVASTDFFIRVFNTSRLSGQEWLMVLVLSLAPLAANEIAKLVYANVRLKK